MQEWFVVICIVTSVKMNEWSVEHTSHTKPLQSPMRRAFFTKSTQVMKQQPTCLALIHVHIRSGRGLLVTFSGRKPPQKLDKLPKKL